MDNATRAKLTFIAGVKAAHPNLYRAAVSGQGGGLSGLGVTVEEMLAEQNAFAEPVASSSSGMFTNALNSTIDFIKQLAPSYIGLQQAKTCLQINADRARAGISPIDCASSGLAPQVSVGVSPDVKYIMYAVVGIGAVYLMMRSKRKR